MAKMLNGANKDRKNKAQMDLTQETSEYLYVSISLILAHLALP
ncbi:hypothetical protein [Helicobacter pylori]|nr:hypothetical protein [Helicobacter pylori]